MTRIPKIWKIIIIYVAAIYLTLPVMRAFLNFLYSSIGRRNLAVSIDIVLFVIPCLILFLFLKKGVVRSAIVITPLIAALIFIYQMERPEERVHFLEYGILGFLVSTAMGTGSRHLIRALLLIVLIGSVDEFIQLLLPNRVGDLRDVLMNATGGVLGLWVEKFWSRR